MSVDPDVLQRLYGDPALAPLWAAARDRLERRDLDLGGVVTLPAPEVGTRLAIARLLGADTIPDGGVRIGLAELDATLRSRSTGIGLAELLEALGGPLEARRAIGRARSAARAAVFDRAPSHPALTKHPALADWLAWIRARGTLSRLDPERAEALLGQALDVLAALPTAGLSLPVLAGQAVGATHALDRGQPLAVLVERALGFLVNDEGMGRRDRWSAVGVSLEGVSSTVLALNLRPRDGSLAPILGVAADGGEPIHVTLRMLRDVERVAVDGVVSLCENRSVIEAVADRLGPVAGPLVCLSGEPTLAARRLVAALAAGGARLRYHGDFDPEGIAIANTIIGAGVEPWRYGAEDYLAAVAATPVRDDVRGSGVAARWDDRLGRAIATTGAVIYEEQVLEQLIADLTETAIAGHAPSVAPTLGPDAAPGAWVAASRTRNWLLGDPLCDWLRLHGAAAGFARDDAVAGFDERTDFGRFILAKGVAFEAGVLALLGERTDVRVIATAAADSSDPAFAAATIAAMREGAPVIAQGVLHDHEAGVFGMPDLLVRADVLDDWFPDALEDGARELGAPGLGVPWHYRVVDIKFHRFDLLRDGHASGGVGSLPFLAQVWLYNRALGRAQGFLPPSAYLVGRGWVQGAERGRSCLERLARVDDDRWFEHRGASLESLAMRAVDWIRRVRAEGGGWSVLPEPSVPELRPNMRRTDDAPWHASKRRIAEETRDLTLLPRVNPDVRAAAAAIGIRRWDDERVSAARLGITSDVYARRLDAVIAANRAAVSTVRPERFSLADPAWRMAAPLELFVDFETVSDLDDDFTRLPLTGGQALIFQVGCGWLDRDGAWQFRQWTADDLTIESEGRILRAWLAHVASLAAAAGIGLPEVRLCHWSAAEVSTMESAYNSARTRHPDEGWPDPDQLNWFDLLERVARAEPLAVTGAFGFGLKAIAKAMSGLGLIPTTWGDGPTDGLGAMVGAWWCDRQAKITDRSMGEIPLMIEIAAYNEVDCRVMAEVLAWLRENR